jgi:hypothetical protein
VAALGGDGFAVETACATGASRGLREAGATVARCVPALPLTADAAVPFGYEVGSQRCSLLEAQVLMKASRSALNWSLYGATCARPWGAPE